MTCFSNFLLVAITVLTLWSQISQAYCLYNRLDGENSHLYVQERVVNPRASFKKQINNGQKECCPWDNRECNVTGERHGTVDFYVKFGLFGTSIEEAVPFFAFCSGGGGLVFTGNHLSNITATCNHANGEVRSRNIGPAQV